MATVVNNPQPTTSNNGMGFLLGAIIIVIFAVLFFLYIVPAIRSSLQSGQGAQINVPNQIDVNVKQQK